jgi:hypothetical protein
MRLPSTENATAFTALPTLRVINSVPPIEALVNWGILGKWPFQSQQGSDFLGQVASVEM